MLRIVMFGRKDLHIQTGNLRVVQMLLSTRFVWTKMRNISRIRVSHVVAGAFFVALLHFYKCVYFRFVNFVFVNISHFNKPSKENDEQRKHGWNHILFIYLFQVCVFNATQLKWNKTRFGIIWNDKIKWNKKKKTVNNSNNNPMEIKL